MGIRVLLVDDHPGFRHQARLLLEEAGYDVVAESADAASAISAARRFQPDLVLVDIGLPDRDGFFVTEALAAQASPPVIVLISGRDLDDYGARVGQCGAAGFLPKAEFSSESLQRVLAKREAS